MRLIKIGLARIDTTVGAFTSNTNKAIGAALEMAAKDCAIGCLPEQVISGYPPEDLVQWKDFVECQWKCLKDFARIADPRTVYVLGVTVARNGQLYNVAAVVYAGKVVALVPKEKLPTYGVFYEDRTFSRGVPGEVDEINGVPFGDLILKFPFGTVAFEVCEDGWSPDGPARRRAYSGAELIINISASPFRSGIQQTRREMVSTRAADNLATYAYVSQVGGNDSLVFDGASFVNQGGRMLYEGRRWQEGIDCVVVDLDRTDRQRKENTTWRKDCAEYLAQHGSTECLVCDGPDASRDLPYPAPPDKSYFMPSSTNHVDAGDAYLDDLVEGCVMGMAGYFEKGHAFKRIGVALSGGRDSALVAALARIYAERRFANAENMAERIRDFLHFVSMPSVHNSSETQGMAEEIAREFGATFTIVPIQEAVEREIAAVRCVNGGAQPARNTLQNIQARIRGMRMWNWANENHGLWLQTSNMSEVAVGYTTIGGDMMGGYSPISNVPKTVVIALLRYIARRYGSPCLTRQAEIASSAELEADQKDEDDLMPFPVLDACYALFVGEKLSAVELYQALRAMWTDKDLLDMDHSYAPGKLKTWVKRFIYLFFASIFKWVQKPQGVHLGSLDLDRERALQLPVIQRQEWLNLDALDAFPD
ncbi:MAG: NAD(+) synthase [Patescibacteria group bacterium]